MAAPIVLLASGTRGDLQPLVALGRGLSAHGFAVRVVTHPAFHALVADEGLAFVPLGGDLNALLQPATSKGALRVDGNPLQALAATLGYLREAQPLFSQMIGDAWAHCRDAGALIVTLPTLWGIQIAEALGISCAAALLQPLTPTGRFPSPFLPTRSLGPALNRLTHQLLQRSLWLPWRIALKRWRRSPLGLHTPVPAGPLQASSRLGVPWLYGISERVVPRPSDWPTNHTLTGYWFLDAPTGWEPPDRLARFLEAGPPPVFVGFGSMGALYEREIDMILAAAANLNQRVLLSIGDSAPLRPLPDWAFTAGPTPHGWLFPRVAAVIHHGGAGTTSAALRAGVPQIIAPVAVDQHFWGQRVASLGLGPPPVSRRALTVELVASSLSEALAPAVRERATQLGMAVRAERGIELAVGRIETLL